MYELIWPNLDPGLYSLISTLIWILLASVLLYLFWDVIRKLISALSQRLESGALVKIWNIELGPLRVSESSLPDNSLIDARVDKSLETEREKIYDENKRLFLAHKLFPSSIEGQLYDILIYVIERKGASGSGNLGDVIKVEYYFGEAWGHKVFISEDRKRRFAVVVSAYGEGFLCFATIYLKNGSFRTWRYIDFESGALGRGPTS